MARYPLISKLMMITIVLAFLCSHPSITAGSSPPAEATETQETAGSDSPKESNGGQVTVQFSRDDVDTITAALPEGKARQMFKSNRRLKYTEPISNYYPFRNYMITKI